MKLEFPDGMPVKAMVELGKLYWGYPGHPRATMRFYMQDTQTVFNLAQYLTAMKERGPDVRVMTKGYSFEVEEEEIGIWIRLKYL